MPDLEQIKISAVDRKSLSSDLDYDDYLPFNDNSAGTEATKAVTIFALNSYKIDPTHFFCSIPR